ncbi:MAG: hypothetical protein ACTSQD_08630 [Promethearchaeota archaeon]
MFELFTSSREESGMFGIPMTVGRLGFSRIYRKVPVPPQWK